MGYHWWRRGLWSVDTPRIAGSRMSGVTSLSTGQLAPVDWPLTNQIDLQLLARVTWLITWWSVHVPAAFSQAFLRFEQTYVLPISQHSMFKTKGRNSWADAFGRQRRPTSAKFYEKAIYRTFSVCRSTYCLHVYPCRSRHCMLHAFRSSKLTGILWTLIRDIRWLRFWDTATYWLKIVNFSYPTLIWRPVLYVPFGSSYPAVKTLWS